MKTAPKLAAFRKHLKACRLCRQYGATPGAKSELCAAGEKLFAALFTPAQKKMTAKAAL